MNHLLNAKRATNHNRPDSDANGDHTVFEKNDNGKIKGNGTYTENPQNPTGFDELFRVDLEGGPHTNKQTKVPIPTPHVKGKDIPGGVRPATPEELPKQKTD